MADTSDNNNVSTLTDDSAGNTLLVEKDENKFADPPTEFVANIPEPTSFIANT